MLTGGSWVVGIWIIFFTSVGGEMGLGARSSDTFVTKVVDCFVFIWQMLMACVAEWYRYHLSWLSAFLACFGSSSLLFASLSDFCSLQLFTLVARVVLHFALFGSFEILLQACLAGVRRLHYPSMLAPSTEKKYLHHEGRKMINLITKSQLPNHVLVKIYNSIL